MAEKYTKRCWQSDTPALSGDKLGQKVTYSFCMESDSSNRAEHYCEPESQERTMQMMRSEAPIVLSSVRSRKNTAISSDHICAEANQLPLEQQSR